MTATPRIWPQDIDTLIDQRRDDRLMRDEG